MNEQNNNFTGTPVNNNLTNNTLQPNAQINYNNQNSVSMTNNNLNNNVQTNSTFVNQNNVVNPQSNGGYNPVTPNNISVVNNQINNPTKKKINPKIIIAIILGIIVVVAGILIVTKFINKKSTTPEEILSSTSFFLEDNNGMYALFNVDGKKLSEFEFEYASDFINGIAVVSNKDSQYALINESGKYVVNYGKYEHIREVGGLFEVSDYEYNEFLMDSNKKILGSLENVQIVDFGDLYVVLKEQDKYVIVNYQGKTITTIPNASDYDDLEIEDEEGYITISYNNKTYVLDIIDGKELASFNSEKKYCINEINEEHEDSFILLPCYDFLLEIEYSEYKIMYEGKITTEKTDSTYKNMEYNGDYIYAYDENYKYFVDDLKGNNLLETEYGFVLIDENHYAINKDGNVVFYSNDQVIKEIQNAHLNISEDVQPAYSVEYDFTYDDSALAGKNQFFNKDGKLITDKSYDYVEGFDKLNNIVVTDEDNKYLMDKEGNIISDKFEFIGYFDGLYLMEKNNLKELYDAKMSKILDGDKMMSYVTINDEDFVYYEKEGKNVLYNLSKKQEIITTDEEVDLENHYFITEIDGKTNYHTYKTGKVFYTN